MTKIAISGLYADSSPAAHVGFTVRLRDAGSGGAISGGVIVAPLHGTLDASGEAEVDLTPNEDVTPAGTFYTITVAVSPTVVRHIEVPQPAGSGEAEVPYAWGDPTIQRLVSGAPTHFPAPEGGTVGDVVTVVDPGDGKRYSLEAATGGAEDDSDLTVTSTAAYLKSATTVAAYTAAAGSAGVSAARQASTSAILPFVITAAGSTQAQINTNAANGAGWAQVSADVAADTAVEASLLALDGEAALRSATDGPVTVRQFDLGADWDTEGHDDRGWSTPFPGTFSGGIWLEAPVTVTGERLPASPTDGQTVYTEIPAIYADGVGNHDLLEWAVESTWYAALGQWIHRLYYEHTSSAAPGAAEDYELSYAGVADGWRFTENQPTRVAAWVDFTDGTNSTGYLLREAPAGTVGDLTLRGRQWRIILKKIGPPTDIDPSISDDLHMGSGHGRILVPELIILNGGPNGTGYASPNAADAWAEGDGPFDDPDGNTWTKDPSGSTIAGTTPSGATTDASELTSGILPAARIGDASITAAKLVTPATGKYVTGTIYAGMRTVVMGGSRSVAPGALTFFPIDLDGPVTIDALVVDVLTGAGSGTAHLYLVTADATTGRPETTSTIVASSALIPVDTSTTKVIGALASTYAATAGRYWAAIHGIAGTPTYRALATNVQFGAPVTVATTTASNGLNCINATGGGTSTTPLTTLSGLTFQSALNQAPIISWRVD